MIVVCDPINPFGTVQTREELLAIADMARRRDIVIFNNITHNTHRTDTAAMQIPMASLHTADTPMDHVVSVSGVSKGYGMPAIRVGFMAGHPALLRGAFLIKMEFTKIHINYPGQYAALAAMRDDGLCRGQHGDDSPQLRPYRGDGDPHGGCPRSESNPPTASA